MFPSRYASFLTATSASASSPARSPRLPRALRSLASLALLVLLVGSGTSLRAQEGAPVPPSQQQRIYSTRGGGYTLNRRVEYTEQGAVIHVSATIELKARPMTEREQELRLEFIRTLPLIGEPLEGDAAERFEGVRKLLDRTNAMNVTDPMAQDFQDMVDAWQDPLRFHVLWLDQEYPPAALD